MLRPLRLMSNSRRTVFMGLRWLTMAVVYKKRTFRYWRSGGQHLRSLILKTFMPWSRSASGEKRYPPSVPWHSFRWWLGGLTKKLRTNSRSISRGIFLRKRSRVGMLGHRSLYGTYSKSIQCGWLSSRKPIAPNIQKPSPCSKHTLSSQPNQN